MGNKDALIAQHITFPGESSGTRSAVVLRDPTEARVRGAGVHVWALIEHIKVAKATPEIAAENYHLPLQAVEAALAYYADHKPEIDARITLNAA